MSIATQMDQATENQALDRNATGRALSHSTALDGIRGLAILSVMLYHQTIMTSETWVDQVALRFLRFGWCGVDLFFVLSGFLITGILLNSKTSPHYFRNFYARRFLRICPLYYGILIFCVAVLPHIPNPKAANFGRIAGDEIWYFAFLQNYVIAWRGLWRHAILDVTWSLAIEEQFYLIWPLVVLGLRPQVLSRVCLAIIAFSLSLRILAFAWGASAISVYVLTPTRLDGLAAGAFVAIALRHATDLARVVRYGRLVLLVGGILLLAVWLSPEGYSCEDSQLTSTAGFTLLAACSAALIVLVVNSSPTSLLSSALSQPLLVMFGKYSYSMYLFHLPLRALIRDTFYGSDRLLTIAGSQLPGQLIFFLLSTLLTLIASMISWQLLEKRALQLKSYFPQV